MENKTRNHWLGPNTENPIDYKLGNFRDDKPFQNIYRNHCTLVRKNKTAVGKSFVCVEGALSFEGLSRFSDPFVAYCFWKESLKKKNKYNIAKWSQVSKLTPLVTQKDGTSTVKSDGIRFTAALEVVPESSAAFYGFHGDAGPRECCRPTALDVVKLQSDDKRVIIQTKVGLFLHRHAKCATQCVSVRIPWPQKLVEIRRTKAQTRPPAGSSKTYFPVWLQVQQTTNPITRWTFYCPFEVFSYFFPSFLLPLIKNAAKSVTHSHHVRNREKLS